MKHFHDLNFKEHPVDPNGLLAQMNFDNGYGVSVCQTMFSYGGESGLYELALLKDDRLFYDKALGFADVRGCLSRGEVTQLMFAIQQLPSCVVEDDNGFIAMSTESSERALQILAEMEIDSMNEVN